MALAHHLLSPANRVVAVTSTGLDPRFGSPRSTPPDGAAVAHELVELLGLDVPVHGEGGRVIVDAAHADDDLPLYVVCGGPLTNVAAALAIDPSIAGRMHLVWVGGSMDPALEEYNRDTDPEAAREVFDHASLAITQFPVEAYRQVAVTVAELERWLLSAGTVGDFLWRQFVDLPLPDFIELGEVWPLGDSPPVLVTALDDSTCTWAGNDTRRVCTGADVRLLVGDLVAKLSLHAGG